MKFTDWTNDFNARQVYREIERSLAPTLARLMPEFNIVQLGINRQEAWDNNDEIRLVIHLKPNGLRMPPESAFRRDHMDGFDDGSLEAIPSNQGMNVRSLRLTEK